MPEVREADDGEAKKRQCNELDTGVEQMRGFIEPLLAETLV